MRRVCASRVRVRMRMRVRTALSAPGATMGEQACRDGCAAHAVAAVEVRAGVEQQTQRLVLACEGEQQRGVILVRNQRLALTRWA